VKIIWHKDDIKGGTQYSREQIGEVWIITRCPLNYDMFRSVSLADGLTTCPLDADAMADQLTSESYMPLSVMNALGIKP
jgi:hypothetical protein